MSMKRILSAVLALVIAFAAMAASAEEKQAEESEPQALIESLVVGYAAYGERDGQALEALTAADPALGERWTRIMDLWEAPVTVNASLPEGLPEDDSLCLVTLGFQLNPDGTMRDELIERLKTLLAAARQYPRAIIVCTGGGTAAEAPEATEAGRMAEWLAENGVDAARILVEDQSVTTAQNAIFTFDLLEEKQPQVRQLAIVSSDYHIATGALLFGAEAILRDSPVRVVSNAGWPAPSGELSAMFQAGALIELSGDVETAFEIYYETYDIHELPSPASSARRAESPAQAYLLRVVDQNGEPVPGVMVNFCTDTTCSMTRSDENGIISFGGAPDVYHIQLLKVPEGYSFDADFELYTEAEYGEWLLRIQKES